MADKYLEFSKLIETDICKVLDAWVKTKEADRKKVKKQRPKCKINERKQIQMTNYLIDKDK